MGKRTIAAKNAKAKTKRWLYPTIGLLAAVVIAAGIFGLIKAQTENPYESTKTIATIEMENGSQIVLELYPDIAPITVANFTELANSGFYDGLIFHRVISGFMIHGGDPTGTGMGGPGYTIKGEFSANGVKNKLGHARGVISMARSASYDSAGSQFFIMHETRPHLDGSYAAFGTVVSGIETVDAIASVKTDADDRPLTAQVMKSVRVETKEIVNDSDKNPIATIEMENGDKIVLELYPSIAPNTVANFISLANEGFYDGLIFHRVIDGFMIQGGDPTGTGMGGPGYAIKGEFLANGYNNNLPHERGVISMARSMANDSAGSQFFIMHKTSPHLDGSYAAFGNVISGIEAVDAIATTKTDANDKPLTAQIIKSIRVDTKGESYPLVKIGE